MKPSFSDELLDFEDFLKSCLHKRASAPHEKLLAFWEGMDYSLFGGGKRFRPLLTILTAKALKRPPSEVYPLAAAVEMIHTYSLIHDDLPCLDNDDIRRGRPTHHKKFGEDMALLAGDGLLTLAFFTLAENYTNHPKVGAVVRDVALASGIQGMVGGQVLDVKWDKEGTADLLKKIHEMKTGALISVSVKMAATLCEANKTDLHHLSKYGDLLGLAFQLSDDIQDAREGETGKNFASLWGEEKTLKYLNEVSEQAEGQLKHFGSEAEPLRELVSFNFDRI